MCPANPNCSEQSVKSPRTAPPQPQTNNQDMVIHAIAVVASNAGGLNEYQAVDLLEGGDNHKERQWPFTNN